MIRGREFYDLRWWQGATAKERRTEQQKHDRAVDAGFSTVEAYEAWQKQAGVRASPGRKGVSGG